jgi:hypothetical protein
MADPAVNDDWVDVPLKPQKSADQAGADTGWVDVPVPQTPPAAPPPEGGPGWKLPDRSGEAHTVKAGPGQPAQSPYNPDAPQAWVPPSGDPLSRGWGGFWSNTGAAAVDSAHAIADILNVASGQKNELDPTTRQIGSNLIQAHGDQFHKMKDAWDRGDYLEAAGHFLGGSVPLFGPVAAHAGERFGATPPVYDKYGNVIKSGTESDVAGGIGEGLGAIFPTTAEGTIRGVRARLPKARLATAGAGLDQVGQAAGHLPIDTSGPMKAAMDVRKAVQSGGADVKVVSDFLKRVNDPNLPPLTFNEAREFYKNASRLSGAEVSNLNENMRRYVTGFRNSLNDSLTNTAGKAGVGDLYKQSLQGYRKGMQTRQTLQEMKDAAKKNVWKGIAGGLGLGGAYGLEHWLFSQLWGDGKKAHGGTIVDRMPSREATLNSLR